MHFLPQHVFVDSAYVACPGHLSGIEWLRERQKKEKLKNACRKFVKTSFNDREISDSSLSLTNSVLLVFLELINNKKNVD